MWKVLAQFAACSVVTLLAAASSATIIHVPLEYPTIQAGIDAAVDGDTVLVTDGTYTGEGNRDIDFHGKALLLVSESGPDATVIDCEGTSSEPHRGFYFHAGEGSDAVVRGFTIRNGWIAIGNGGGIYCLGSSPSILGNTITANKSGAWGGGIYCEGDSRPTIAGNTVTGNTADLGGGICCAHGASAFITGNLIKDNTVMLIGGGVCCWDASPTIRDNEIVENRAPFDHGGGVACGRSSSIIENNIIAGNVAWEGGGICCWSANSPAILGNVITGNIGVIGGGIRCHGVSPAITGNTITANSAEWGGGIICDGYSFPTIAQNTIAGNSAALGAGILCWAYSSAEVRNNIIVSNAAAGCGGGIHCWRHSSMTLTGNTIAGNTADESGGAIHCLHHSTMTLSSSTVAENRASVRGGGIECCENSSITVVNSIFWGDSALSGPEVSLDTSSSITIGYSDVEGGWPGGGNIDADPVFVLAEKGDYRLLWGSPCVDSGHPDSLDQDGTRSDMGAHFFDQEDYLTLYLTPDTTEVMLGGELGVTYTLINRWAQPEVFWILTQVVLPGGDTLPLCGPDRYTLPAHFVARRHLSHEVPPVVPSGAYGYRSGIGVPPALLYDRAEFTFAVTVP